MNWLYICVSILNLIMISLAFYMVWVAANQRYSREQNRFLMAMFSIVLITVGSYMEYSADDVDIALLAVKLGYIGRIMCLLLIPRFVYEYLHWKMNSVLNKFIWIVNIFMLIIILTCEYNSLFYIKYYLDDSGPVKLFVTEKGLLYWPFMCEMYLIFFSVIIRIIYALHKYHNNEMKFRLRIILISVSTCMVGLILNITGLSQGFDLMPFSITVSGVLYMVAIKKYHMFDIEQSAKDYVLDYSEEAVAIINAEQEIIYRNKTYMDYFENYLSAVEAHFSFWIRKKEANFEFQGKTYQVETTEILRENQYKEGYLVEIRDMTEVQNQINEMIDLRVKADNASKSKSAFLANMSHEIRTPINAVLGMGEMILRESTEKSVTEYATSVNQAGRELLDLVNNILDYSKMESGKMKQSETKYEFQDFFERTVSIIHKIHKDCKKVHIDADRQLPCTLVGDYDKIQNLMVKLIENCERLYPEAEMKYYFTFENRKVEEEIENARYPMIDFNIIIDVLTKQKLNEGRIRALKGFNPAENRNTDIEKGDMYFALIDKIVESFEGNIIPELLEEGHERFTITIPQGVMNERGIGEVFSVPVTVHKEEQQNQRVLYAPKAKILIVDDNVVNLKVIQGLLKRTGIQTKAVVSGRQCLELISKEYFDIIFMDHLMTEMDGIETLHTMKKLKNNLCVDSVVIILTANVVDGAKQMYLNEGFHDYLMKPVDSQSLENMIRRYLNSNYLE